MCGPSICPVESRAGPISWSTETGETHEPKGETVTGPMYELPCCERRRIARRRTEKERAEAFFLCERRRRRIPSAMRERRTKGGASRLLPLGTAGADGAR